MTILVLSTCLHPIDFQNLIRSGQPLNPSHQTYYEHLLATSALSHRVVNMSLLPLGHLPGMTKGIRKAGQVAYHYALPSTNRLVRLFRYRQLVKRWIREQTEPFIIFVDGNSKTIMSFAKTLNNTHRTIIITDHPTHLSSLRQRAKNQHASLLGGWDSYITLTPSLNEAFNRDKKPFVIIPGFAEPRTVSSPHKRPYFFFSGALYNRYGIDRLLDAFRQLNRPDIDLVVAGHGPESSFLERLSQTTSNIKFLGLIDHELVYRYQANALLNVQPRPRDPELDADSIPSKLFEFLSSGAPTMSVIHPFFYPRYAEDVEWLDEGSVHEWVKRLTLFLQGDQKLHINKAQRVKTKVIHAYSRLAWRDVLDDFIKACIRS
jgi:glycosyltransferase involved in cell wall biosynthesis